MPNLLRSDESHVSSVLGRDYIKRIPDPDSDEHLVWRLCNDIEFFSENVLKIQTKGKLVPFQPNYHQKILNNIVRALRIAKVPVRIIILKARRMGMSTDVEALGYQETSQRPYRRAKVVAHTDESARYIFDMTRTFYDETPEDIRPMSRYSTRSELVFENPDNKTRPKNPGLRSKITVATAGSKEAGRGEEVHFLHLSEVAFYENAANLSAGLLQTVDYAPDTSVFMESTANGTGYFHDMYWKHKEGKEELIHDLIKDHENVDKLVSHIESFGRGVGYIPLFFPWHEFQQYRLPVTTEEAKHIRNTMDGDEQLLMDQFGLSIQQIKWRRAKIDELATTAEGISPVDLFKQEYPSSDREAFLVTGRSVFNPDKLALMNPQPAVFRGRIMTSKEKYRAGKVFRPALLETPYGELAIYSKPKPMHQYAIGGDIATAEKGRDFSCLQGLDKETLEHVFEWHGKTVDPDVLGRIAMSLGWYYNRATVALERNSIGIASIISLRDSNYPFIYVPKEYAKRDGETPQDRLGWETTSKTKAKAIGDMIEAIRTEELKFNSVGLISECVSFKVSPNGKLEAEEGKHDDRVLAMAIALQAVLDYPPTRKPQNIIQVLQREKMMNALSGEQPAQDPDLGDILP